MTCKCVLYYSVHPTPDRVRHGFLMTQLESSPADIDIEIVVVTSVSVPIKQNIWSKPCQNKCLFEHHF